MRDDGAPVRVALLHAESRTHSRYTSSVGTHNDLSVVLMTSCVVPRPAQEYIWSALQKMGTLVELLLVVDPPSPA